MVTYPHVPSEPLVTHFRSLKSNGNQGIGDCPFESEFTSLRLGLFWTIVVSLALCAAVGIYDTDGSANAVQR
jgi:hypothetical protein